MIVTAVYTGVSGCGDSDSCIPEFQNVVIVTAVYIGVSACRDGYYGAYCTQTCSPAACQRCDRNTGACQVCLPAYNVTAPACTGTSHQSLQVPCRVCVDQDQLNHSHQLFYMYREEEREGGFVSYTFHSADI